MKRVKVLIPFHFTDTNKDYVKDDVLEISNEQLAKIKAVNVNMVLVLEEVKTEPKKAKKTTK